jgi:hypothetical protein
MDGWTSGMLSVVYVVCIIPAGSERKGWDIIGDERGRGVGKRERERGREGGLDEGCEVASHKSRSRSQPHIHLFRRLTVGTRIIILATWDIIRSFCQKTNGAWPTRQAVRPMPQGP